MNHSKSFSLLNHHHPGFIFFSGLLWQDFYGFDLDRHAVFNF